MLGNLSYLITGDAAQGVADSCGIECQQSELSPGPGEDWKLRRHDTMEDSMSVLIYMPS
jgi:hypothetical protein